MKSTSKIIIIVLALCLAYGCFTHTIYCDALNDGKRLFVSYNLQKGDSLIFYSNQGDSILLYDS